VLASGLIAVSPLVRVLVVLWLIEQPGHLGVRPRRRFDTSLKPGGPVEVPMSSVKTSWPDLLRLREVWRKEGKTAE
jgi:hypothetical protein